jgi:hypothetical protein
MRVVWRQIVDQHPVGWFTPVQFPVLEDLCRNVVFREQMGAHLSTVDIRALSPEDDRLYSRYLRTCNAVAAASQKLRLTIRTQRSTTAPVDVRAAVLERPPWETDDDE